MTPLVRTHIPALHRNSHRMPNGDIDGRKPTNLSLGRLRSSKGCGVNPPAFAEKRRHGLDGAETVLRVEGASARFGRDFARHDVATMRSCMSTMSWAKYAAALRIGRAPFLHSTLRSTAQAPESGSSQPGARAVPAGGRKLCGYAQYSRSNHLNRRLE